MQFINYLKAGYPLMKISTHEEDRTIKELSKAADGYKCFQWDIVRGLETCDKKEQQSITDPVSALEAIASLPQYTVVFFKDFHRYAEDLPVYRTIKSMIPALKSQSKHIVFLAPVLKIPVELEKDITVIEFNLPSVDDLMELASKLVKDLNREDIEVDRNTISAARGLTMAEAENAFARSLVTSKKYDREILEAEKLQAVKKSGLMEIYPAEKMESVGGLEPLKKYIESRKKGFTDPKLPTPKGILLTGLPGSGKTLSAKATASALGMPLVRLDLGTLKGGLVGQSEANMKRATDLIDAIAPCVVWLDEIEKALAGVQSSGKTDGGTGSNMFGQLLTWMQESQSQKYIVATCNDIADLLIISQGALLRRFDDVFFVDMPSKAERMEILKIMIERYGVDGINLERSAELTKNWTGAEIEKFVKNSLYDGIEKAGGNVKPIYQQNKAIISRAREWSKLNAIAANEPEKEDSESRNIDI